MMNGLPHQQHHMPPSQTPQQTPISIELIAQRDAIQRHLADALFIVEEPHIAIRAPVIVSQGDRSNTYMAIEQHLRPEVLSGPEKFWKLARAIHEPSLETWRPRVNGVQLKALQGVRLPNCDSEWNRVQMVLESVDYAIRGCSSPQALLSDLKDLTEYCAEWWDTRNKPAGSKRPPPLSPSAPPAKRRSISHPMYLGPVSALPESPHQQHEFQRQHSANRVQPFALGSMMMPPGGDSFDTLAADGALDSNGSTATNGFVDGTSHHSAFQHNGSEVDVKFSLPPLSRPPAQHLQPPPMPFSAAANAPQFPLLAPLQPQAHPPQRPPSESLPQQHALDTMHGSNLPVSKQKEVLAILEELEQRIITLNVGGHHVTTTAATLAAVEGSFLWKLVFVQQAQPSQRTQAGDFFIDRDGKVFEQHVIRYLRALHFQEPDPELPRSPAELSALVREADWYSLPGLAASARTALEALNRQQAGAAPQPEYRLAIDISVSDQSKGTVTRCHLERIIPAAL